MKFIKKHFAEGMMLLNLAMLIGVAYMMFWPFPLTEVLNEPFPVEPYEIQRGDTITVFVEFEKYRDYPVELNKNIICNDGNLVTLAPSTSQAPTGHHDISIEITIPQKVSDGTCHFEFRNTYHINPLRQETLIRESQDFVVIE